MSDTPHFRGAMSPESGDDILRIVAGEQRLDELRRLPSLAGSAFESLQGLSNYLKEVFGTRLVFVSCRDTASGQMPEFLFDTARSAFAAERGRLFGLEPAWDVAIGMLGRPIAWQPKSDTSAIAEKQLSTGATALAGLPKELIAIPYQCGPLLSLCVVQPLNASTMSTSAVDLLSWHCINYIVEHFRHHPMRTRSRASLLSPQEERVVLRCGEGLTDKEIGREMNLSPHTVRTHINSAKTKLGAKNKTHAVMLFARLAGSR